MRGHHLSSLWKAGLTIVSAWLIFLSSAAAGAVSAMELQDRLAADVQFLSQPRLHGRKTRSAGARLARHYIGKEFQDSGLVPWGRARDYELSFGLGKNVVGVVSGSDVHLSKEVVLLSAHYDHLGKDRKGRLCPGAADNASGVAVLLEAARRFGAAGHRPKRTIALAAFDAEEAMLLGSFAFSCRPDVEQANIVAVINVDMLGRDFLDTISNTVFLAGTEYYPDLQPAAGKLGDEAGLRVLTLGSDLIGPRSDHIAFEDRDIPCLFFSCGTFSDYHGPGDTAARLNYSTLRRSTEVILRTVERLANGEVMPPPRRSGCDLRELRSVRTVVAELSRKPESAGIKTNDLKSMETLKRQLDRMAEAGAYTLRAREQLVMEATRTLGGYFLPFGEAGSGARGTAWADVLPVLEHLYLNYHRQLQEGQRQLVRQVLGHPPGLFHGTPPVRYEMFDIAEGDISFVRTGNDRFALHALGNGVTLAAQAKALIWPFGGSGASFAASLEVLDCAGGRQEILDYCLLHFGAGETNVARADSMKKVVGLVLGAEPQGAYRQWLETRLTQGAYTDETQWLLSCLSSDNPSLVAEALAVSRGSQDPRVRQAVREIITRRQMRPDVRAQAISIAARPGDKAALLNLVAVLPEQELVSKREYCAQFAPDYPLTESLTYETLRPLLEHTFAQPAQTLGQAALAALKKATKRDFGRDPEKWRNFVNKSR